MQEGILDTIPNKLNSDVIALYTDYEGNYTQPYTFMLGCMVSSLDTIPEGMTSKVLPSGAYAEFVATGEHPAGVVAAWQTIWEKEDELNRTYISDYEVYGPAFHGPEKEVRLYIGVK